MGKHLSPRTTAWLAVILLVSALAQPVSALLTPASAQDDSWWPGQEIEEAVSGGGASGAGGWEEEYIEDIFYPDPVSNDGVNTNAILFLPGWAPMRVESLSGKTYTFVQAGRTTSGGWAAQATWSAETQVSGAQVQDPTFCGFCRLAKAAVERAEANKAALQNAIRNSAILR